MKTTLKARNLGIIYGFFMVASILSVLVSCAGDEATVNEGVADDGTPLGPGTELSAGLEEDLDPNAQLEGVEFEPEQAGADPFKEYQVMAHYLNVRKGPANTYPVVRVLRKNQTVKGSLTKSGWLKLDDEEFISIKYLKAK